MQSKATTVTEYLQTIPADRQKVMTQIRKAIKSNLPKGFEEVMQYGMIGYVVPHKIYKDGYHSNPDHPLPFISLASQKNYISFYHMALYGELLEWFTSEWPVYTDKKLDMGKCCVRFKNIEEIPIDLLGTLSSKLTVKDWIEQYEKAINSNTNRKSKSKKQ